MDTTSRAFQPIMDTPPNTDERMTTTLSVFCWSGIAQISSVLSPETIREKAGRREGGREGREGRREGRE